MTAAEAPTAPRERAVAWPSGRAWVDAALLTVLATLGVLGFSPSFGGFSFLAAGIGGLVLGVLTALVSSMLRLGGLLTLASALVLYFLIGPAVAVPSQTIVGVIPTLQGLSSVAIGTVFGWADIVTLSTPVGAPVYIAVVPYAAAWIVTLVSTLLALRWLPNRPRSAWRFGVALLPAVALYLTGILVGTDEAYQAGVRGVAFAVIVLVWIGWRKRVGGVAEAKDRSLLTRKVIGTVLVAAIAVGVGGGAGFWLSPAQDQRFVLRDEIEPPFDPLDYPSPLSGFRHFTKQVTDDEQFTVTGLQPGDRIRMATLDSYTGKLWNVTGADASVGGSGSYELVGRALPAAPLITPVAHAPVEITITGYDDVWVPGVGYPSDFELLGDAATRSDDLRYNASTGSMVLTSGLSEGDSYRIDAVVQDAPSIAELAEVPIASVELPPVEGTPDIITSTAQEWAAGATDPAAQLEAIRLAFVTTGFLSHGRASDSVPSRAGHGADRVSELLERTQMIGDEEQYTSAFALMARSLGFPARIVMGFAPEVPEGGGSVSVTGDDVTAWVEVAFDGVGWVPFLPTPDETDIPQDQVPKPQSEPQPQVRQPPRNENDQEDLLTPVELEKQEEDDDAPPFVLPGWAYAVGISLLSIAAIVFLPILIVSAVKARRMRKRRSGRAADQAAGAWAELADQYSELGYDVPSHATRSMTAGALAAQFPATPEHAPPPLGALAGHADALVFAGGEPAQPEVDAMWESAMGAVDTARDSATSRTRLLSRYRVRAARDAAARLTTTAPRRSDP